MGYYVQVTLQACVFKGGIEMMAETDRSSSNSSTSVKKKKMLEVYFSAESTRLIYMYSTHCQEEIVKLTAETTVHAMHHATNAVKRLTSKYTLP